MTFYLAKRKVDVSAKRQSFCDGWEETVDEIHRLVAGEPDLAGRLLRIANQFLDLPHVSNPLVGGPEEPERLVINFRGLDCVTFIETVLALARSRSRRGFVAELKKTRYRNGQVDWCSRLHYFSEWMRHNEKRGAIKVRTRGSGSRSIEATLGLIPSLPVLRTRFHVVPKRDIRLALGRIAHGSVVAFASTRSRLDFFHTGLIFLASLPARSVEDLILYSPPRSIGRVIAEPLGDFFKRNRMRGIAFAEVLHAGDCR